MNHLNPITATRGLSRPDADLACQRHPPFLGLFPHSGFLLRGKRKIGGITFEVMRGKRPTPASGAQSSGPVVADTDRTIAFYRDVIGPPRLPHQRLPMKNATYRDTAASTAAFKASFTDLGEGGSTDPTPWRVTARSPTSWRPRARDAPFAAGGRQRPGARGGIERAGIGVVWTCPGNRNHLARDAAIGGMRFAFS